MYAEAERLLLSVDAFRADYHPVSISRIDGQSVFLNGCGIPFQNHQYVFIVHSMAGRITILFVDSRIVTNAISITIYAWLRHLAFRSRSRQISQADSDLTHQKIFLGRIVTVPSPQL